MAPERRADCEKALNEAAAALAVAAEAALAHQHSESKCALGGIIGRLDALYVDEGEEGVLQLEACRSDELRAGLRVREGG